MNLSFPPTDLIKISALLGKDKLMVQAAGGNTSVKIGRLMWVKASGKWLSNADKEEIFIPVDIEKFHNAFAIGEELTSKQLPLLGNSNLKPSIETALHAAIPYIYVLHVHPISILSHAVLANGEKLLASRFVNLSWTWLSYVKPGWELALEVAELVKLGNKKPQVIVLANHGLVVAGDDLHETTEKLLQTVMLAETASRSFPEPDINKLQEWLKNAKPDSRNFRAANDPCIHSLALDPVSFEHCQEGALYPDQVVFLGSKIHCSNALTNDTASQYVVVEGIGVFVEEKVSPAVEEMLRCHAQLLSRISRGEKFSRLSNNEVKKLVNWDAEKYRRKSS